LESRNKHPEEDYWKDFQNAGISSLKRITGRIFTISKLLESRNKLHEGDYWMDFYN
jgi:hypothetical protein